MSVSSSSSSQTMPEGVCGCILACTLWVTGPSEVSFRLHCFIVELNTHTLFEFNALEWPEVDRRSLFCSNQPNTNKQTIKHTNTQMNKQTGPIYWPEMDQKGLFG